MKKIKVLISNKEPSLRARILPSLVLAILFIQGVFMYIFSEEQQNKITEIKQLTTKRVEDLMKNQLENDTEKMKAALESLIRDPILMKAFSERNVAVVTERSQPLFQRLKKQINVSHFYFHLPNRVNFLRLHRPDQKGDIMNRVSLKYAQKTGKISSGIEQGITGNPVLRVVYPWRSDYPQRKDSNLFTPPWHGQLVGFLELGIELQDVAQDIHKLLNVDLILAMDKKFLNHQEWEKRNKHIGKQSAWNDFRDFVIIDKTIDNIPDSLRQEINQSKNKNSPDSIVKMDDQILQVIFVPLIDIDGRNLGNIIAIKDISQIIHTSQEYIIITSLISIIIGGSLIAFFYIFLAKVEKNIADNNTQLTESKIKEFQLEQSKKAADAANQAKSDFLAKMSHELRTPLNGIMGYVQILQHSSSFPKKHLSDLGVIHQCSFHLLTLIEDILDISKIEAGKMDLITTEFSLSNFLTGIINICQIKAQEKNLIFTHQYDPFLPSSIETDEKRLRQVLLNLLNNAIKFTETGTVCLRVKSKEQKEQENHITITIEVEDMGVGIFPEQLEQIFLPFEQVGSPSQRAAGTGLGLSITQKILQLMDSQLMVKSTPGVGSLFSFSITVPTLIRVENNRDSVGFDSQRIISFQGNRHKVLIVDDISDNRAVIVDLLQPLGFDLEEANNGKEGLIKAVEWQPNLVIVDLIMPDIDGWEMVEQLRQSSQEQDIIVIASSANVSQSDRQRSQAVGCNDFLPKPIQAQALFQQLQKHLQIQWIYESIPETESTTKLIIPPVEIINKLTDLAKKGRILDIVEETQKLREQHQEFTVFANYLNQLAEEFELEKILTFLIQHEFNENL